jgi:hypothetical protein
MGFLTPIYLLLGAGVAVPVLVHLLRRRSGARVDFPAARYLVRAEQEHSRQLRVRNVLLMLLRVAAVALLALAAARPVIGAAGGGLAHLFGAGHAPMALAVVVDNSLSTSAIAEGRPVLDGLKAAAQRVIDRAAAGDRVWLVTADGEVRPASALAATQPLAGAGDLPRAIERAASLVRSAGLPTGVITLATDGQGTAWTHPVDVGNVAAVVFAPGGSPPPNHAVTGISVRPSRWTPDGEIVATILGARDSATYRVTVGGRTLARGTVSAAAASAEGTEEVSAHVAPPDRGWIAGTVELEPDELRGDDIRHFAVWVGNPPVVEIDSSAGPFARGAADALVAAGRAVRGSGRGAISIVAADRVSTLPALIVAPRDPVRIGAANRALERAGVPWRFGTARTGTGGLKAAPTVPAVSLADAAASQWYTLEPAAGAVADTLVTVGVAEPWAVAGAAYVLIAAPIDPTATTFPVHVAFVPWIASVITERLGGAAGGAGAVIGAAPGETVHRPEWAVALEASSGAVVPLTGSTFTAPTEPGVGFLRGTSSGSGGGTAAPARVGALVVNAEASESDLRRLAPRALAAQLHSRRTIVQDDPKQLADSVFDLAAGRPLVAPLLIAALALLIVEAIVLRGTGRARRRDIRPARAASA